MRKEQKIKETGFLAERIEKAKAMIFAGYRGLNVAEMTELRTKLRKGESTLKVVKNRLMKRVLKEKGMDSVSRHFREPTAVASSEHDPVNIAKVLIEFARTHDKFVVKGGYLEGKELSTSDIETLSKMPPREVLIARALGSMIAPASNLARVLQAIPRKVVYAINAIKDTKKA